MKTPRFLAGICLFNATLALADQQPQAQPSPGDQYEILPRGTVARAHFWISDGPADIFSVNQTYGNRFRLGAEAQLGNDYQWILGGTLFDILSSGETSPLVGDISRFGWDINVGYFLIPDKLWLEYSFYLGTVRGSFIDGHVGNTGHGVTLGYRIYDQSKINLALEASYLYIFSENVAVFNFDTQTFGTAYYPHASVASLNLTAGFDLGGR